MSAFIHFRKKHMMQYQQDKQAQNTVQSHPTEYPLSPSSLTSGNSTPANVNNHLTRPNDYTRAFPSLNSTQNFTNNTAIIRNSTQPTEDEVRRYIQSAVVLPPTPPTPFRQEPGTSGISQYPQPSTATNPFVWAQLNQLKEMHLAEEAARNREIHQNPSAMNPNFWGTFNQPHNSMHFNEEARNQSRVDPRVMNPYVWAKLNQLEEIHLKEELRNREIIQGPSAMNPNHWTTFNQAMNSVPSNGETTNQGMVDPIAMNQFLLARLHQLNEMHFTEQSRAREINQESSAINSHHWVNYDQLQERPFIKDPITQEMHRNPSVMNPNLWAKLNKSNNSMPSIEEARNLWTRFNLPNNRMPFTEEPTNQDNVVPTTLDSNAWTKFSQLPQNSRTRLQQLVYPENSTRNFEETSTVEPRPRPDNAIFLGNRTSSPNAISLPNAAQTHDSAALVTMENNMNQCIAANFYMENTPTEEAKPSDILLEKINGYNENPVAQHEKYPITGQSANQSAAIQGSNINEAASYPVFKPYADGFGTTKHSEHELPNDKPLNLTYKNCQLSAEKPESVIEKELVAENRYKIQSQQQSPEERPESQKEFAINNLYAEKSNLPHTSQAKPKFIVREDPIAENTYETQPLSSLHQKRPEFVVDTSHCELPKEKPESIVQKEVVAKNPYVVESHCQLPKERQEVVAQKELEAENRYEVLEERSDSVVQEEITTKNPFEGCKENPELEAQKKLANKKLPDQRPNFVHQKELEAIDRSEVSEQKPESADQKELAYNNPHEVESPEDTPEYVVRKIALNQNGEAQEFCQLPQETPELAEPPQPITIKQELTAPQDNNSLNQDEFNEKIRQLEKRIMSTLSIGGQLQNRFEAFKKIPNVFVLDHTTAEHTEQINKILPPSTSNNTTENNHPEIQYPYPSPDDETKFIIGPRGTTISKDAWLNINWYNTTTAITRKILMGIFDRETLATHSLTGRPSPAFVEMNLPNKDALDADKVVDTIYIVTNRTNATAKEVRMAITTKCADECKMYKWREDKNFFKINSKDCSRPNPY